MDEMPPHLKEYVDRRNKLRAENPPVATDLFSSSIYFNWSWKGCGFGQLSVDLDIESGALLCNNECMRREDVRKLLHAYADFIADRCILTDNLDDIPPVDYDAELTENKRLDAEFQARRGEKHGV